MPGSPALAATKCFSFKRAGCPIPACAPHPQVYRSGSHSLRQAGFVGDDMTLINFLLWLVLAGLIAIVPIGCVMTRPSKKHVPHADKQA